MKLAEKTTRFALILALFLPVSNSFGEAQLYAPKVGDEHEITKSYETSSETSAGSSGSSSGSNALVERVIGVREGGFEIEYDLPYGASAEERARTWQFPARVFRSSTGPMQLLNRTELEARVEAWLQAGGMTREACGRWIFTWNAFRIDCEPESVIHTLNSVDLRIEDLKDGALYDDTEAISPGMLEKTTAGENLETFVVKLQIDPEAVRRARAESDAVVGELVIETVTLEEALSKRGKEVTSGTILVTIEADRMGNVWRRTRVTKMETTLANGQYERETATEIVERHPIQETSGTQ